MFSFHIDIFVCMVFKCIQRNMCSVCAAFTDKYLQNKCVWANTNIYVYTSFLNCNLFLGSWISKKDAQIKNSIASRSHNDDNIIILRTTDAGWLTLNYTHFGRRSPSQKKKTIFFMTKLLNFHLWFVVRWENNENITIVPMTKKNLCHFFFDIFICPCHF